MATNCRFAFAIHVLSALALQPDDAVTSEELAHSVNTNPVVIRRLLGEMADAGIVETQRGPGGGARLSRPTNEITLLQIHHAVAGEVEPFGEHPNNPAQNCTVGREIKRVLEDVALHTKQAIEREYSTTTLADLVQAIRSPASV